jgi:hypothetical protein
MIRRTDHENTIAQLIMSQLLVVLGMVRSNAFDRDRPGTFRPRWRSDMGRQPRSAIAAGILLERVPIISIPHP